MPLNEFGELGNVRGSFDVPRKLIKSWSEELRGVLKKTSKNEETKDPSLSKNNGNIAS